MLWANSSAHDGFAGRNSRRKTCARFVLGNPAACSDGFRDSLYDGACDAANGPVWAQGRFSGRVRLFLDCRFGGGPCYLHGKFSAVLCCGFPGWKQRCLYSAVQVCGRRIRACRPNSEVSFSVDVSRHCRGVCWARGCQWFQSSCGLTAVCRLVSGDEPSDRLFVCGLTRFLQKRTRG